MVTGVLEEVSGLDDFIAELKEKGNSMEDVCPRCETPLSYVRN